MAKISLKTGRVYGHIVSTPDHRDHVFSAPAPALTENLQTTALPQTVANVDLRPKMPPVYDQGNIGSCTGNSISASIEYERKMQKFTDVMPSRLFIYYNERLLENTVNSDAGAQIRDGIKAVNKYGVCPESEWPYIENRFTIKPSVQCYTDALKEMVLSYAAVPVDLTQMKAALSAGYPIIIGIAIFESFESDAVAKTGIVPMPKTTEKCLGGHCMLICGFCDQKQQFIVRNSWGTSWGDKGYCYIPYSYLTNPQLGSDYWIIKSVKS